MTFLECCRIVQFDGEYFFLKSREDGTIFYINRQKDSGFCRNDSGSWERVTGHSQGWLTGQIDLDKVDLRSEQSSCLETTTGWIGKINGGWGPLLKLPSITTPRC